MVDFGVSVRGVGGVASLPQQGSWRGGMPPDTRSVTENMLSNVPPQFMAPAGFPPGHGWPLPGMPGLPVAGSHGLHNAPAESGQAGPSSQPPAGDEQQEAEPRREGVPQEVIDADCKKMSFADAMADEMARNIKESMSVVNGEENSDSESKEACERDGNPEHSPELIVDDVSSSSPRKEKSCCGECSVKPVFIPGLQMDTEEDRLCEICQCGYEEDDEVMVLPCNHFFHVDCVSKWLSMRTTCPKCRYEVSPAPEEEEQQVIVTRTTTIEWMPVTQWVPASTTTVEVRHEVGSDMETVTTTTTRPVGMPFSARGPPGHPGAPPPPFPPPGHPAHPGHPGHPAHATAAASPPTGHATHHQSGPGNTSHGQPQQPPLPQLLSDVQAQEYQRIVESARGSPHIRPNGSPRMMAMSTPLSTPVYHRRSGSWNGISPGFSPPHGPTNSMMISSQGHGSASSPQLQPLTTNGLLPPTPPLMPGGPMTMVPAMEITTSPRQRYPEQSNQRVMAM